MSTKTAPIPTAFYFPFSAREFDSLISKKSLQALKSLYFFVKFFVL